MIYILWEDPANIINSVLTPYYSRYPRSSRASISKDTKMTDIDALAHPPLLNDGWLVLCNSWFRLAAIKALEKYNKRNLIFIQVKSSMELEKVQSTLEDLEYRIIDNHKIPKEVVIFWITKQLRCTQEVAKYLYQRTRGNVRETTISVQMLSTLPSVSRGDVTRYTRKSLKASVFDLTLHIVGEPTKRLEYKDLVQVVHEFKYASNWLLKNLSESLDLYLHVFQLMSTRDLTLENFKEYRSISGDKKLKSVSEYRLQHIMDSFGAVSTEYLFFVKQSIDVIPRDMFSLYRLLLVLRAV